MEGLTSGKCHYLVALDLLSPVNKNPRCKIRILNATTEVIVPESALELTFPVVEALSISELPETLIEVPIREVIIESSEVDLMRL